MDTSQQHSNYDALRLSLADIEFKGRRAEIDLMLNEMWRLDNKQPCVYLWARNPRLRIPPKDNCDVVLGPTGGTASGGSSVILQYQMYNFPKLCIRYRE